MSCFFGHKWTKWTMISVTDVSGSRFDMQERECTLCGLTKRKYMM